MAASFNVDLIGACERIRKEASELAGQNYAYNLKKKTGALDFITSPENGRVDASLVSWDNGRKVGTLKVLYDQRTKSCQVGTTSASVCDDGSRPARKQFLTDIDGYIHTPVREFSNDDMVVICKDTKAFIQSRLMSDINAAHEKFSELVLAELLAARGKNYEFDGTTTAAGANKTEDLIGTSGGQNVPLPGNFADMLLDYQNNQLTGRPAIIGQGNIQLFAKLHNMSCCNATTPYGEADIAEDALIYIDQNANEVLGANNVIMAAPGVMHLVTFNENRNININTPTHQNIVIPDPLYPFDWNLDFYWDACSKSWKYMLSLHYTIFNVYQADSFSANDDASPDVSPDCDDDLLGMLGVFGYSIT
jgi:hypothetical protein